MYQDSVCPKALYIGNLSPLAHSSNLAKFLCIDGIKIELVPDPVTLNCKGYGYVFTPISKVADLLKFNGKSYLGKNLVVQLVEENMNVVNFEKDEDKRKRKAEKQNKITEDRNFQQEKHNNLRKNTIQEQHCFMSRKRYSSEDMLFKLPKQIKTLEEKLQNSFMLMHISEQSKHKTTKRGKKNVFLVNVKGKDIREIDIESHKKEMAEYNQESPSDKKPKSGEIVDKYVEILRKSNDMDLCNSRKNGIRHHLHHNRIYLTKNMNEKKGYVMMDKQKNKSHVKDLFRMKKQDILWPPIEYKPNQSTAMNYKKYIKPAKFKIEKLTTSKFMKPAKLKLAKSKLVKKTFLPSKEFDVMPIMKTKLFKALNCDKLHRDGHKENITEICSQIDDCTIHSLDQVTLNKHLSLFNKCKSAHGENISSVNIIKTIYDRSKPSYVSSGLSDVKVTQQVSNPTDHLDKTTKKVSNIIKHVDKVTEKISTLTQPLNKSTQKDGDKTTLSQPINKTTQKANGTTNILNKTTQKSGKTALEADKTTLPSDKTIPQSDKTILKDDKTSQEVCKMDKTVKKKQKKVEQPSKGINKVDSKIDFLPSVDKKTACLFTHKTQSSYDRKLNVTRESFIERERSSVMDHGMAYTNYVNKNKQYPITFDSQCSYYMEENYNILRHRKKGASYNLLDIAAILTHKKYRSDLDQVIMRAQNAGVNAIVIPGMCVGSSQLACAIAKKNPGYVFFTAGVHPHNARMWDDKSFSQIEDLVQMPECVGIGEIGLDFMRNFSPEDKQLKVFEKQMELAVKYQKPMLLHERQTHGPFMKVIRKFHSQLPPCVVHCFTGKKEHALMYVAMGFYIGITGYLARPDNEDSEVRALLKEDEIPMDKLLLETDCPFMYPNLFKGKYQADVMKDLSENALYHFDYCYADRMEPCGLPVVAEMVSSCLKRKPWEVAETTTQNAIRFFNLETLPYNFG